MNSLCSFLPAFLCHCRFSGPSFQKFKAQRSRVRDNGRRNHQEAIPDNIVGTPVGQRSFQPLPTGNREFSTLTDQCPKAPQLVPDLALPSSTTASPDTDPHCIVGAFCLPCRYGYASPPLAQKASQPAGKTCDDRWPRLTFQGRSMASHPQTWEHSTCDPGRVRASDQSDLDRFVDRDGTSAREEFMHSSKLGDVLAIAETSARATRGYTHLTQHRTSFGHFV